MNILDVIKGQLVVSCQALPDEPLHSSFIMGRMARAAKEGGAVAIRAQGVADICEIREAAALPVIGIIKKKYSDSEIYITATKNEVEALLESHCDMIALDGTLRRRPNGESFGDLVRLIKAYHRLVMADISDVEEALAAQEAGVDCVSTTLSGYTSYAPKFDGPDFDLIRRLAGLLKIPLLAEGRINTPEDLKKVYEYGAYSAVVGSAITRPQLITGKFVKALQIN